MDHEHFRDALYADQSVDGLESHLETCEDCRRLATRLERIDRVIREIPIPEPSPGLLQAILRATTDQP